jgi:hypothetical protein
MQASREEIADFRRFLYWFAIFVLAGIVLAVTFVLIVDPYDQYRLIARPGFNLVKPGLARYQNELKLTKAVRLNPDVLILGHSRAEVGLDPEAAALVRRGLSAYNLAIPGSGIANARKQMEYLLQNGIRPKVIILGMEFLDFMQASPRKDVPIALNHGSVASSSANPWFWHFDTLFSLASLSDAVRTLLIQHNQEVETITSRGFNPLKQYRPIARNEGYYGLFQQRAQENAQVYLKKSAGALVLDDFAHLQAILDIAVELGSEVKLIIYPYHAQILVLFEETGLWPDFEDWKKSLMKEIAVTLSRHPGANIALFDFSGYGSYNCEGIPAKGDRTTATKWYWEAGHFKGELGAIVLESVLSSSDGSVKSGNLHTVASEHMFGFQLDESTSTANSRRISGERSHCSQDHPELFRDTASLVAEVRRAQGSKKIP